MVHLPLGASRRDDILSIRCPKNSHYPSGTLALITFGTLLTIALRLAQLSKPCADDRALIVAATRLVSGARLLIGCAPSARQRIYSPI